MKTVRELLNEIEECRAEGVEAHLILDDVVRDLRVLAGGCPNGSGCCGGCDACPPDCPSCSHCQRACECYEHESGDNK